MAPDTPAPPPPPDDLPLIAAIDDEDEAAQVLLVRIAETRLAIPIADLREVLRAKAATRLPGADAWITGLVAVRGVPVPVGDLVRRADPSAEGAAPWLVIVEQSGRQAALGVSAVDGVRIVLERDAAPLASGTLPRAGSARLQPQADGRALGAPDAVDVLDVTAVLDELFDGD